MQIRLSFILLIFTSSVLSLLTSSPLLLVPFSLNITPSTYMFYIFKTRFDILDKNVMFFFPSLAYCTDDPHFHPFCCGWHNSVLIHKLNIIPLCMVKIFPHHMSPSIIINLFHCPGHNHLHALWTTKSVNSKLVCGISRNRKS